MSEEMEFFIFLLEQYSKYKGEAADSIMKKWDESGLTDIIFNMYERYHSEALENAFSDIDKMFSERNKG